jgi:hypothetical protein
MICPLCDETFDDESLFTGHLGAAHELYDEAGTSSEVTFAGRGAVAEPGSDEPVEPFVEPAPERETIDGIPANRVYDPRADDAKWRPVVIVACLLLLGGAVAFLTVFSADGSETSSEVADGSITTRSVVADAVAVGATERTVVGADPLTTETTAVIAAADTTTTLRATSPPTTARRTTATTAAPTTTAPPAPPPPPPPPPAPPTTAGYVAPSATDARVDGCARSGNDATWQFSYVLSGGSAWRPGPTATASGGRLVESRSGRVQDGFATSSIQVVDDTGAVHGVPLQPALSEDRCR